MVELTFAFVEKRGDQGTGVMASWCVAGLAKAPGPLARAAASFGLKKDLLQFEQLEETGEIAITHGQSSARPQLA